VPEDLAFRSIEDPSHTSPPRVKHFRQCRFGHPSISLPTETRWTVLFLQTLFSQFLGRVPTLTRVAFFFLSLPPASRSYHIDPCIFLALAAQSQTPIYVGFSLFAWFLRKSLRLELRLAIDNVVDTSSFLCIRELAPHPNLTCTPRKSSIDTISPFARSEFSRYSFRLFPGH